jgi:GAF domain-containing protein/ANTAR domain-containing protein
VGELDGWARLLDEAAAEHAAQPGRICHLCVQLLGVTGAGISMVTADGHRGVVCATDEAAARIEDLQLTLGEGACIDAVQAGMPIMVSNLDEPGDILIERWPAFMKGVGAAGVRAVFAFPLRIGAITVGVLDLYRDQAGDLTAGQFSAALMAADAAAIALLYLDSGNHSAFSGDIGGRAVYQMQVHQATGMVKVQLGVTIEEAFLMLRARAFAAGRPLVEVAHDVVERRLRFSTEDR